MMAPWTPPRIQEVQTWALQVGEGAPATLTVLAPLKDRVEAYTAIFKIPTHPVGVERPDRYNAWIRKGVLPNLLHRTSLLIPNYWGVLWDLFGLEDFVVEEPLRSLIDQGFRFTELFRALWEARFLLREGHARDAAVLVDALIRWMRGGDLPEEDRKVLSRVGVTRELDSSIERLDIPFFLLALARQNCLVDQTIFIFDEVDAAVKRPPEERRELLRDLLDLMAAADRWKALGSGVGIVVGVDPNAMSTIQRHSPKLAKKMRSNLV